MKTYQKILKLSKKLGLFLETFSTVCQNYILHVQRGIFWDLFFLYKILFFFIKLGKNPEKQNILR